MEESLEQRVARLKEKVSKGAKKKSRFRKILKYTALAGIPSLVLGTFTTCHLSKDFLTKRQNYPERNVLFRTSNTTYVAGSIESSSASRSDRESITQIYEGGLISKVGTFICETEREVRDDIEYFSMEDSQHIRIASSTKKPEIVQAGLRIRGSLNFREQFAEIILDEDSKAPQKYTVYKFIPERGLKEREIAVIDEEDGTRIVHNRLMDGRSIILGWLYGDNFRSGTFLEDYAVENNHESIQQLLENIRLLDSDEVRNMRAREKLVLNTMDLESDIPKEPIYMSYEDGIIDWLPQESSIYLAEDPSYWWRVANFWGFGRNSGNRLRVENHWDLWPGNYPFLNNITFGEVDNQNMQSGKYNNGGYTLIDKYGDVARIDIKDFLMFYGQDVLYSYYLDLNGNGEIEEDTELIGQVLCRPAHDRKVDLETVVGKEKPEADLTVTTNYSFMAPTDDAVRGLEYFNLCAYLESCIPDQIHRGFGKHSLLGFINEQRSDIMLYNDLTIENMSRALTQESPLVAEYDIVKVLAAAGRPYAEDLAVSYGIRDQFADDYFKPSTNLDERFPLDIRPLGTLALIGGGLFYLNKRRRDRKSKKALEVSQA